jgi:peptide/nickel transport system substrate-binding protein
MKRLFIAVTMSALGSGLLATADSLPSHAKDTSGGTFRISAVEFDAIDPAIAVSGWKAQTLTCAPLMGYPDQPSPNGFRVVPEVAQAWPRVSRDSKTYTFTIRRGLRFSNGAPLTARNFEHAIKRLLDPRIRDLNEPFTRDIAGVKAIGRRLIVQLNRPAADLPARMTIPAFCPVPLGLPVDPEGIGAPLPSAGPYFAASWIPGRRLVLRRNRFYRGHRPHRFDEFVFYLDDDPSTVISKLETGERDWGGPIDLVASHAQLAALHRKFGLNRKRYFVTPSPSVYFLALNTSRPLFRHNARLRRAVNFAIDRTALLANAGPDFGAATDQYLPPVFPGYRDARIYPLRHPDLARARALARGHMRSGRAVVYARDTSRGIQAAQIVQKNLAKIGLEIEIKTFPAPVFFAKIGTRGEPFDIAPFAWLPEYFDPSVFLNPLFDGGAIRRDRNQNISYFNSPKYNHLLAKAARLRGRGRHRFYGQLDVELAKNAAPMVAWGYEYERTFVSRRVGCIVINGRGFDLAAACLRR